YPHTLRCHSVTTHHTPRSTPFPYTTLFRSALGVDHRLRAALGGREHRLHRAAGLVDEAAQALSVGVQIRDGPLRDAAVGRGLRQDRKSTRLNSSHQIISYAVFCLKKKNKYH